MTGTIITRTLKDGSKRYSAVYRGAGRQIWKTFHRRKDAERHLTDQTKRVNDGNYVDVKPVPMGDLIDRWLRLVLDTEAAANELKPSYVKSVRSIVKVHIRPAFADHRSDQLSGPVAEWLHLLATKQGAGKLQAQTKRHIIRVFGMILNWGLESAQRHIAADPLADFRRRRKTTRHAAAKLEVRHLEPVEIQRLLDAAAGDALAYTALLTAAYTGLRRGELFGLQWGDLDEVAGQLRVRRAVYQGSVGTPKTRSSIRGVDIPEPLVRQLRTYRKPYPPVDERGFVFRNATTGGPLDPDNFFSRVFVPLAVKAGLRPEDTDGIDHRRLVGLHTLRHSYVAMLLANGADIKYTAAQLGHSDVSMTLNVYSHLLKETSVSAMNRLAMRMPTIAEVDDEAVA